MGMDYWISASITGVDPAKCLDHLAQSSRFSMALKSGDICVGTGDYEFEYVDSAQDARAMLLTSFELYGYCGFKVVEWDTDRSVSLSFRLTNLSAWSTALCPEPEFRAWFCDVLNAVGLSELEFELDCF